MLEDDLRAADIEDWDDVIREEVPRDKVIPITPPSAALPASVLKARHLPYWTPLKRAITDANLRKGDYAAALVYLFYIKFNDYKDLIGHDHLLINAAGKVENAGEIKSVPPYFVNGSEIAFDRNNLNWCKSSIYISPAEPYKGNWIEDKFHRDIGVRDTDAIMCRVICLKKVDVKNLEMQYARHQMIIAYIKKEIDKSRVDGEVTPELFKVIAKEAIKV